MNKKQKRLYELKKKDPWMGVIFSLLLTGAGSAYAGKWAKGILIFFTQIFLWFFLLGWIMWILAPIVAYFDVKRYNEITKLELED